MFWGFRAKDSEPYQQPLVGVIKNKIYHPVLTYFK